MNAQVRRLLSCVVVLAASGAYAAPEDEKVTVCHVPPGNPDNAHDITISPRALDAHLAHGDRVGSCASAAAGGRVEETARPLNEGEKAAKIAEARGSVDEMRGQLEAVVKLEAEARESKDLVVVICVSDKLTSLKGLLRLVERAFVSLQESLARNDFELALHEETKIKFASQRGTTITVEAQYCVGQATAYTGSTVVDFSVEGDERQDDPSEQEDLVADLGTVVDERPQGSTASE